MTIVLTAVNRRRSVAATKIVAVAAANYTRTAIAISALIATACSITANANDMYKHYIRHFSGRTTTGYRTKEQAIEHVCDMYEALLGVRPHVCRTPPGEVFVWDWRPTNKGRTFLARVYTKDE